MKNLKLIWLILLVCLCAGSVFAQSKSGVCENFGKKDYQGENLTIKVEKTDVRDILKKFTEKYGCKFVVDKSVTKPPLDVNVSEVPWNIALDAILRSQDLGIQINGNVLRVADVRTLEEEKKPKKIIIDVLPNESSLFTEFIKIKKPSEAKSDYLKNIQTIISRRLTKRGSIEIDERSNSLVVTDVRENLDAIKTLINILDSEEKEDELPLFTEFIKLKNLKLVEIKSPDVSKLNEHLQSDVQFPRLDENGTKFIKLLVNFLSRRGAVEMDTRTNTLIITDKKEKVTSVRKEIEEWDKPTTNLNDIIKTFESKK